MGIFKNIVIALILLIKDTIIAWHAYNITKLRLNHNNNSNCPDFKEATKPYNASIIEKLKLWPGMMSNYDVEKGQALYGSAEALEIIHRNQNPDNCSEAQYLISGGWPYGFGSRIHMEGVLLGMALHMNRVYLPHPDGDNFFFETDVPFCKKGRYEPGMNCFYESYSKCTVADAVAAAGVKSHEDFTTIFMGDFKEAFESPQGRNTFRKLMKFDKAYHVVLTYGGQPYDKRKYIPRQMMPIIECSPMRDDAYHYWWRAVSATYIARPNQLTLNMLSRYTTLPIQEYNECITMFVRHGDKGMEMKLLDFESYRETAQLMWDSGLVPATQHYLNQLEEHNRRHATVSSSSIERHRVPFNGSLFITSEDPAVIEEAEQFGKSNNWKIYYTNLFDRKIQTAYKTWDEQHKKGTVAVHDDLEYISMLLNLYYSTRSEAWVCTLASNSCRIMDEFRVTLGAKANRDFADLSIETCANPPCLAMSDFTTFAD